VNDPSQNSDANEAALAGFGVPTGADQDLGRDELERLASALTDRVRAGESPDIAELAGGEESLHSRLRELAPLVAALEQWKVQKDAEWDTRFPQTFPLRRVGDCRLIREIGRGGNGIVFEAVQGVTWFRTVAVKVSPWRIVAQGRQAQRFLEEAATLSRLQHPHIIPIYSYSTDRDYPYYVMRLAEGGSVDRVISHLQPRHAGGVRDDVPPPLATGFSRNSWRAFATIGLQVASALEYAHAQNVVHGDVKPANVLLDAHGQVLVTDFGTLLEADADSPRSLTGTYRYMAPERFDGVCDVQSDVYALVATLYELLVTTPAFEGENPDSLINRIRRHDLIAPKLVRPDVPADLDAIVSKAMARDPAKRYRTAGEMSADLLNYLNGRPVMASARRRVGWKNVWPFRRRN
jgi:serine/threonine-protein kinase